MRCGRSLCGGGLGLFALILTLGIVGCGTPDIEPTVPTGEVAFLLPDLDGNLVSLTDERFAGKVVLVDIWGTWCPPCRMAVPDLVTMKEQLGEQGLEIVGIAFEESPSADLRRELLDTFIAEENINYIVLDGGQPGSVEQVIEGLVGFRGFPTMLVIGRDGRVVHANTVFYPDEKGAIEAAVKEALDPPKTP